MQIRMSLSMLTLAATLLLVPWRPEAAQPQLPSISSAWAGATAPGATVGAAYLTINSRSGDTLTGATTPVAAKVEMHTTTEEGGMMKMRPLQTVELQPGRAFAFAPGGAHFMLIGLKAPLAANGRFPLTLHFRTAGNIVVEVTVTAPGTMPPAHH